MPLVICRMTLNEEVEPLTKLTDASISNVSKAHSSVTDDRGG